jgi:hypothetical protein
MREVKISALIILLAIGLVISATPVVFASKQLNFRPMIFVHGFVGSAQQFESQAMRFTSNGYPPNYIAVLEYDTTFTINTMADVWARLDQLIANLLAETGAGKIDLIGHSLGTSVCQGYLRSSTERASKVAHYVNIDGMTASSLPGGVPTLAIWGMGSTARNITGALNVYFLDQSHVQVCTSAESFVEMYKFFTGEEPLTKYVLPEPPCEVRLAGRVVVFPLNIGVENATLEIWEVDGDTGIRIHTEPEAIYHLGADGAWGPFNAKGGANYEFALVREGDSTHHFYREPFIRSNYWITLLASSPAWGGVAAYMNRSDHHSCLVIGRNKEFWGDQGVNSDILEINGVNVVTANICPQSKRVNGMFVYDKDADGVSNLAEPIAYYHGQPFFTGVDLYIPAADPPNGTISLVLTPRGGGGKTQIINVPNWASSNHRITVQFNDYVQDVKMLLGFGGLRIDGNWNLGKTIVYIIDRTVIDFRVEDIRVAWDIVDRRIYKGLEFYKGESELGSITIVIIRECAVACGSNVIFLGLLVY